MNYLIKYVFTIVINYINLFVFDDEIEKYTVFYGLSGIQPGF
jgi:hypothetical protein